MGGLGNEASSDLDYVQDAMHAPKNVLGLVGSGLRDYLEDLANPAGMQDIARIRVATAALQ